MAGTLLHGRGRGDQPGVPADLPVHLRRRWVQRRRLTLVAQYTGADSAGSAGTVAGQTLGFITAIAVAVGLLGYAPTNPLLAVLPSSPATVGQVIPLAAGYMRVFFAGLPFLFGFFVFSSLMRGYGNTRAPTIVMAVSVFVDVVIDPILIFGVGPVPELGVIGAAVATVLSRGIATVTGLYVLLGTAAGPDVSLPDFRPRLEYVRKTVRVGVPSAAEQSASALGFITLTAVVVTFSPEVVAAYGLGNRLVSLVFLPALGLGRVHIVYGLAVVGDFGPAGIWIGMAAGQILGAVAAGAWFTRGTWKSTVIDEGGDEAGDADDAVGDSDDAADSPPSDGSPEDDGEPADEAELDEAFVDTTFLAGDEERSE